MALIDYSHEVGILLELLPVGHTSWQPITAESIGWNNVIDKWEIYNLRSQYINFGGNKNLNGAIVRLTKRHMSHTVTRRLLLAAWRWDQTHAFWEAIYNHRSDTFLHTIKS